MFTRILVCVDGSPCSIAATRAAVAVARHNGAELLAIAAFHPKYAGVAEIGAWAVAIDQEEIERWARLEREDIQESICPILAGLDTPNRFVQETGHPVEVILRVAERENVDLVVVGSRGLRGVKELLLGSVSSAVMHHASCPVLIVHGDHVPTGETAFRHIVLTSDGSQRARKAAAVAVEMARSFATSLTVLNVCTDISSILLPEEIGALKAEEAMIGSESADLHAERVLGAVEKDVSVLAKAEGVYCAYVQVSGHPYDAIVRYTKQHPTDLIVMGSRGLGGFEQMLVGSVSNYVAHHTACPVMVVH